MFYVLDLSTDTQRSGITVDPRTVEVFRDLPETVGTETYGESDIDFVDDALLNTAPHNRIEQQLLRGDVVGLALMSGAILWSAMGAFG
ncbi:hypothetical protein [Methylopila sp. M107]|uniref:hypothetical protein n=1 Tax=Methylopila sp. M107 TaxID=1101190 RepID=UPI00036B3194|nr:hypothetical protein [Methylopila sp. M107]